MFFTNRSQAVRLPKEFQFNTSEVFISRDGDKVILLLDHPVGMII